MLYHFKMHSVERKRNLIKTVKVADIFLVQDLSNSFYGLKMHYKFYLHFQPQCFKITKQEQACMHVRVSRVKYTFIKC